ncbi:thioredoxin fold domain-containing protein [Vibrio parahaemolyticus]|uniref:Thiol:disulfide interchange protein DsbC n=1 Tax=Vibrio vulnificus TaxID=672 RepID=A0AAN1UFS8_VIBVL|nr:MULTISPECIES: thioredoxin fold domain-containing protein [Vibrio]AXX63792.1 Thiol:disulfide interchange protein DsbC [Vibrio vulnificus]MBE4779775.1 thioredoxin fold domain-containing protein [Vibrio parahaemolyticus]MCF9167916.1 thioredoxin fold domain-containing protein [Vibrio parahaemolyticus]MCX8796187.1 thioredoxin fold domain-containing protein [Vibrio parahaemolyticus]MDG3410235.1 thioredoxin fold domain-containing protein [Vibrio parahaemolyticus]
MKKTILALALTVISLPSLANDFVNKEIAAATIKTLPGLTESDIVFAKHDKESNFNVVRLKTGQVLYGDQNLKHFIVGDSYSRNSILASDEITGELYNHTSSLYSDFHKSIFDNLTGYGVQAKSKDELIKVKVFFEPRCGYCNKLHDNEQKYLDAGISIEYIPYPIYDGEEKLSSKALAYMISAETQAERKERMELMIKKFHENMQKPDIAEYVKDVDLSILQTHIKDISNLAIEGTPYILGENGIAIPGYAEPEDIIRAMMK